MEELFKRLKIEPKDKNLYKTAFSHSSYVNEHKVKNDYDYVLIDCMPSLGLIPLNCLSASNDIIIPVQSHYLAAKGMTYLFDTIRRINVG